jgi:hypothetical protein
MAMMTSLSKVHDDAAEALGRQEPRLSSAPRCCRSLGCRPSRLTRPGLQLVVSVRPSLLAVWSTAPSKEEALLSSSLGSVRRNVTTPTRLCFYFRLSFTVFREKSQMPPTCYGCDANHGRQICNRRGPSPPRAGKEETRFQTARRRLWCLRQVLPFYTWAGLDTWYPSSFQVCGQMAVSTTMAIDEQHHHEPTLPVAYPPLQCPLQIHHRMSRDATNARLHSRVPHCTFRRPTPCSSRPVPRWTLTFTPRLFPGTKNARRMHVEHVGGSVTSKSAWRFLSAVITM